MDSPKLDTLLDELSDLAQQSLPPAKFYASILKAVLDVSQAHAAGLWSVVGEKYRLESEAGLLAMGLDVELELQGLHEDALASVSGLPTDSPESCGTDPPLLTRHFQEFEFRFFPCRNHGRAFVVLEVVTANHHSLQWEFYGRLLAAIAEIVNDYYMRQRLNWLESQQAVTAELVPVLARIYARSTWQQTAFEIANEGRQFLECDRLTVFRVRQGRCEVACISGVDRVQTGSRHVRALCDLAESVTVTGRPLTYSHQSQAVDHLMPQQEELVQRYLDVAVTKNLHLVPLLEEFANEPANSAAETLNTNPRTSASQPSNKSVRCIGALALEGTQSDIALHAERLAEFCRHAQRAMTHAIELESVPLLKIGRRLQRLDRSALLRKSIPAVVGLAAVGALFAIPTDLTIQANGRYQPSQIQHVFAPLSGEINQFPLEPRAVKKGEPLIVMRSRQWELKREETLTQRGVTLEKLRGVESARLNNRRPAATEPNSAMDLSASERELRELLTSQEQQLAVIDEMLKGLTIASPVDGTLLSWNPLESWELRPVQQGQKLLTIAMDGQAAQLQLHVRDSDMRHVWATHNQIDNGQPHSIPVTFAIASEPGARYTAQVTNIGTITETVAGEGPSVRVSALVNAADSIQAKHGATVVARIHCGRTSLAYAWTRRLWDYIAMHWLP